MMLDRQVGDRSAQTMSLPLELRTQRSRDLLGRVASEGPLPPRLGMTVLLVALGASCAAPPRRAPVALDLIDTDVVSTVSPEVVSTDLFGTDSAGTSELPRATTDVQQQQQPIPQQPLLIPDPDAGYRADFFAAKGVYIGARGHWSSLGGDFDGETALVGPDRIDIPEADDGYGYELALGWLSEGWAMELSYTNIYYEGSIGAQESDIDYYAVTWNVLHYLRGNESVQPYFLFGLLYSWADLEDASTLGLTTGDAHLSGGFGIDAGLGVAWWLSSHLALDVRALGVYQSFEQAEGVGNDSESINDGIEGPSFGLSVGLTYVLGNPGSEP